jgi:hypothetical protein
MLKIFKPHKLKPSKIIGFDVETSNEKGFEFAYDSNGNRYSNQDEAIDFLSAQRREKIFVTGMNIAYDFNSLFPKFNPKRILNNGKFITLDFEAKHGHRSRHIKALDIGNFIQGKKMSEIAKKFGFEYIDIHDINHPDIEKACFSHAKSEAEVIISIQKIAHSLGVEIQLTAPSTALKIFQTKFLRKEHQIYDNNNPESEIEEMKKISLQTYHGAATEVFKKGTRKITMLDVVSMYPYSMLKPLPDMNHFRRIKNKDDLKGFFETDMLNFGEGMAMVEMIIPDMVIPPFIYQTFHGKNVSKCGTFNGWLNFVDIRYCLKLGCKIKFLEIYYFSRVEDFFLDYINFFFELKKHPETKEFAKLMLNSLYGKFGQKFHEENNYELIDSDEINIDIEMNGEENGHIFKYDNCYFKKVNSIDDTLPKHSYPLIASYITSYARVYLHETMMKIGADKIVYCDTDSIGYEGAIQDAINANVCIGSNIGNYELKWIGIIQALRPKMYRYIEANKAKRWEYVIKGVPKQYMKEFWTNGFKCFFSKPRKYFTAIRSGQKINEWIKFNYSSQPTAQKRIFENNGNSRALKDNDTLQIL